MCEERGELAGGVGSEDQGVVNTIRAVLRAVTGVGVTIWDHPKLPVTILTRKAVEVLLCR